MDQCRNGSTRLKLRSGRRRFAGLARLVRPGRLLGEGEGDQRPVSLGLLVRCPDQRETVCCRCTATATLIVLRGGKFAPGSRFNIIKSRIGMMKRSGFLGMRPGKRHVRKCRNQKKGQHRQIYPECPKVMFHTDPFDADFPAARRFLHRCPKCKVTFRYNKHALVLHRILDPPALECLCPAPPDALVSADDRPIRTFQSNKG